MAAEFRDIPTATATAATDDRRIHHDSFGFHYTLLPDPAVKGWGVPPFHSSSDRELVGTLMPSRVVTSTRKYISSPAMHPFNMILVYVQFVWHHRIIHNQSISKGPSNLSPIFSDWTSLGFLKRIRYQHPTEKSAPSFGRSLTYLSYRRTVLELFVLSYI